MKHSEIETFIKRKKSVLVPSQPEFFDLSTKEGRAALSALITSGGVQHVSDDYVEQLKELFAVKHPPLALSDNFEEEFSKWMEKKESITPLWQHGRWVYFPWLCTLTHILEEKDFFRVRTTRNHHLISPQEQKKFYDAVIGVVGLSVGNSVALALVLQGGARHIKIADHDVLALSNTNRVSAGVQNLGMKKVLSTARYLYALNPYAQIDVYPDGLTEANMEQFFSKPQKLDLMIDEVDNLALKYRIREYARKHRVPVIMGADNGDNAVIDIERYDKNSKLAYFHKRLGSVTFDQLKSLTKQETGAMIARHIGKEHIPERMLSSLGEIGKTIVSWPQLGGAALLNGAALAYCARKIVTGQPLEDNRALISLDEHLIPQ